ncbi:hypothetical protein [Ruegeria lacuscaerulensis]|uniref:hypothetical protein n=1 Tax=Ruegeria lacuscaerulensis TaxID=55218 RepID=UPI00147F92B5|nr:hypothetical protein [Ruegeria lacuscaerulensis]
MSAIEMPRRLPIWQRLLITIFLFGRKVRDAAHGEAAGWGFAAAAIIGLWGCSALLFGLPGLYIPAVAMVPVVFLILILISRG